MMTRAANQLARWLDELGRISDERDKLTRTFLSPAMRRANARAGQWMRAAGLHVRDDQFGNLIGRLQSEDGGAPTLVLGSHLDTVRDAGRFDGALGVLLPIVALQELKRRGVRLPFAVEVIGFSEEEGVRFGRAYIGSKGYAGQLRAGDWSVRDADGVSVREALRARQGGTSPNRSRRKRWLGYMEVHIEQGPVLEAEGLALGVVSAIAGQTRGRLTFRGQAGHAGTTPMNLRRDALAGAAEFVSTVETYARARSPLVATVGMIVARPGAANVIPGEVILSLDVRHPRDAARRTALRQLVQEAHRIARRRRLSCAWEVTQDEGAVQCSAALSKVLGESVRAVQRRSRSLVSGAGHDAVILSRVAPVAMLFVRCRAGLSHHPDELVARDDLDAALRATIDFIERLARMQR
jgi:allantoate deiminase